MAYVNIEHDIDDDDDDGEDGVVHESKECGERSNSEGSENEEVDNQEKHAMADVLAKILRKKGPKDKNTILAKGKTDRELFEKKAEKGLNKNAIPDEEKDISEKQLKKKLWENMGRVKPDITKRQYEKNLQKIATRGVVQLFNAVKKQQKIVDEKLKDAGSLEHRREKALKSMTKNAFIDVLKGTKVKSIEKVKDNNVGDEPSWKILRDDFMMSAKMKDWDKESDGSNEDEINDVQDDLQSDDET